jgi:hypothetical protein
MMKRAESSFRLFANHSELSHLHHAKKLVPFKTFTSARPANPLTFNAQFFVGIAFGTNVFLRCHTDVLLFRYSSRENVNICWRMRLLYIFVFL